MGPGGEVNHGLERPKLGAGYREDVYPERMMFLARHLLGTIGVALAFSPLLVVGHRLTE